MLDNTAALLAILLTLVTYFSDQFCFYCSPHHRRLVSAAAGISVTYLFLQMLPELYVGVEETSRWLFFFVLIGFVLLHLAEKYVYQHAHKGELVPELMHVHHFFTFAYHFVIGIVLVTLTTEDGFRAVLFFFPVLLHSTLSSITLHRAHLLRKKVRKSHLHMEVLSALSLQPLTRALISAAPLYGAMVATFSGLSPEFGYALIGFVAGALLFLVIKDTVPPEREGSATFFILGMFLYTAIIIWTWKARGLIL